jgi:hypothetical protein
MDHVRAEVAFMDAYGPMNGGVTVGASGAVPGPAGCTWQYNAIQVV